MQLSGVFAGPRPFTKARAGPSLRASPRSLTGPCRTRFIARSTPPTAEEAVPVPPSSGEEASEATSVAADADADAPELTFVERSGMDKAFTAFRLAFALPWRRFKDASALSMVLSDTIAEQPQPRFSSTLSLPTICEALTKATYDPRVTGLVVKIDPLSCGWAKLLEIRRHIELFKQSGKWTVCYLERAGEKEYFLASAFAEVYAPPCASLSLRGVSVAGSFLRGVLDKVGVEPELRRIGKYKSAGDQLLRTDMSEAQREQLTVLLDDIYGGFVDGIASGRGKTREEAEALLDSGCYEMEGFAEGGWVDGLKYEDEVNELIKERTGGKKDELRVVPLKRYRKVGRSAFGLDGGNKVIAVVRTSGAITGGSGGSGITSGAVIAQLRSLKKNKKVAAVVLRIDSPGGDALASDLMWREIQKLSEEKPVIASMADVAASGGYYMAMAARKIVAEALTLTGSIGVITGKFNFAELYKKTGFAKETISRGKFAEMLLDSRSFTEDEKRLFDAGATHAYESFRNKAAASRGMEVEAMQEVAQGRVWSGKRAASVGLVDAIGGVAKAVALAKEAAGIDAEEQVRLVEFSRASTSPLSLLSGLSGASSPLEVLGKVGMLFAVWASGGEGAMTPAAAVGTPALMAALTAAAAGTSMESEVALMQGLAGGAAMAALPELAVDGVASRALAKSGGSGEGFYASSELFPDC